MARKVRICLLLLTVPLIFASEGDPKIKEVKQWYDETPANLVKKFAQHSIKQEHGGAKKEAPAVLDKFEGWGHKKQLIEGWKLEHAAATKAPTKPITAAPTVPPTAPPGAAKSTAKQSAESRLLHKKHAESTGFSKTLAEASEAANALIVKRRLKRAKEAAEWKAVTAVKATPPSSTKKSTKAIPPPKKGAKTEEKVTPKTAVKSSEGGEEEGTEGKGESETAKGGAKEGVAGGKKKGEKAKAVERLKARRLISDVKRLLSDAISSEETLHSRGRGGGGEQEEEGEKSKKEKLQATLEAVKGIERMVSGLQEGIERGAVYHETVQKVEAALEGKEENSPQRGHVAAAAVKGGEGEGEGGGRGGEGEGEGKEGEGGAYQGPPARHEWLPVPGLEAEKKWLMQRTP